MFALTDLQNTLKFYNENLQVLHINSFPILKICSLERYSQDVFFATQFQQFNCCVVGVACSVCFMVVY
jgi:hypothetical protein